MCTGFLIANLSSKLKGIGDLANQHLLKKLYIYIAMNKNQPNFKNNEWISKRIFDFYTVSSSLCPNLDVRIIINELKFQEENISKIKDYNIDVFMIPRNYDSEKIQAIQSLIKKLNVVYIDELTDELYSNEFRKINVYENVVIGGTFDRLHNGHKILLSEALLRCTKKLIVGVTDETMVKGKKLWELMQSSTDRINEVEKFIKDVDSSIDYEILLLSDLYGPTKSDPNIDMIVVSSETHAGALKINELRIQKQLKKLDIHIVDLAEDSESSEMEEKKISSSNIRMRLLGTHIKIPEPKVDIPLKPYVIGLTGGLASGKSSICEYLKSLGAGVIDCDKVAHQLYKPNTELHSKLVKQFGENILSENGEINRKILGNIVFKNSEKLQLLNNLTWPAIYKSAMEQCYILYTEENKNIVVLEAAVLLRAGWHHKVHEVWSAIIPQDEAISRVMKRNNLTKEEAELRIKAQPSNEELVEVSNVVLCSLWSYEYTRQQVNKAWETVQIIVNK